MEKHQRRSIRLPDYDYGQVGAYFVTICVHGKEPRLGDVAGGEMRLNPLGQVAADGWSEVSRHFPNVNIGVHCVMPNHVHAIIVISDHGRGGVSPPLRVDLPAGEETSPLQKPTLGQVVAFYKYNTTKRINQHLNSPGVPFWQRNYYERVIRNQRELEAVHDYIVANPLNWDQDEYRTT